MSRLDVRVFQHIDEVAPAEWDALLGEDDLQATHAFVKVCQDSGVEQAAYRHLLVMDGGRAAGLATLSVMNVSLDLLTTGAIRALIRFVRRGVRGFLRMPVAMCGLPVSFGDSCVRVAPGADGKPVVQAVAAALEDFAREHRAGVMGFKELSPELAAPLEGLPAAGYFHAASLPFCSLRVQWKTFDEYLGRMRSGYRRQAIAARSRAQASGLTVRKVEDFGPRCPDIFRLYEQVMDRVPFQLERLNLAFFQRLNEVLGPRCQALLVEREQKLLAAGVLLYTPGALTFLLAGIDYADLREHGAYLVLLNELVAEATRTGKAWLHLGQTSYALKGRMGATLSPRHLYVRHRSPAWHALLRSSSGLLFPSHREDPRRVFRGP